MSAREQSPATFNGYRRTEDANGTVYEGMHEAGRPHGYGHMRSAAGASYEGAYAKGLAHGYGRAQGPNGLVYEGNHVNGKRTGHGRTQFPGGSVYEGEHVDSVFDGYGRYTNKDKTLMSFRPMKGDRHVDGYGELHSLKTGEKTTAYFVNNVPTVGTLTNKRGDTFVGSFRGGTPHCGDVYGAYGGRTINRVVDGSVNPHSVYDHAYGTHPEKALLYDPALWASRSKK